MGNLGTQYGLAFTGLSITEVVSSSITVVGGTTMNYFLDDRQAAHMPCRVTLDSAQLQPTGSVVLSELLLLDTQLARAKAVVTL